MYELGELGNQSTHARRAGASRINPENISDELRLVQSNCRRYFAKLEERKSQEWVSEVVGCQMFPVSARITITGHLSPDHAPKRPNLCDVPPSGNFVERNGGIIEYYFQFDSQGYLRIRCCIQKSTQG